MAPATATGGHGGGALRVARNFASLVKLSHSVFALPFALLALLAATQGRPAWPLLGTVVLAAVAARTAAMAYNRFADRALDAANPRTQGRELPRGAVSPRSAFGLALGAGAVFVAAAFRLNALCGWLAVPTLLLLCGYSHAKRFTALCHVWLGVALGLAPVAAWLAVDGAFSARLWPAALLGGSVAAWVAGFDVLYACQDEAFDRAHGLHSLPARWGAERAMWASRLLHLLAGLGFAAAGRWLGFGYGYAAGMVGAAAFLVWQHRLLRPGDLSRIDMAFFTANGALALLLFAAGCLDLYGLGGLG
jgi:4-hydroxybenzoate polyprenyltransferase